MRVPSNGRLVFSPSGTVLGGGSMPLTPHYSAQPSAFFVLPSGRVMAVYVPFHLAFHLPTSANTHDEILIKKARLYSRSKN